jgi:hypothetical protein
VKKNNDIKEEDESKKYFRKFILSFILSIPVFSMMFMDTMLGKTYF